MSIGRVPGATGIQPSIVTAKGDLIVATASGSVTNQAVGSNNQVLTADSAQADGVKWANGSAATLTTTGDILYASAANTPARLGIGSTGQVLTVSGGVPAWGASNKVLQVVNGTTSSSVVSTSTTYVDTGLTATITPSSTSNKILIMYSQPLDKSSANATNAVNIRLLRSGTTVQETLDQMYQNTTGQFLFTYSYIYLDSPSSTSALTYKTQIRNTFNGSAVSCQSNNNISSITLMEIGA